MVVIVRLDVEPSSCAVLVRYRPGGAAASAALFSQEHQVDKHTLLGGEPLKPLAERLVHASQLLEAEHQHLVEAASEELRVLLSQAVPGDASTTAATASAGFHECFGRTPLAEAREEWRVILLNMAGERLGCVEGADCSNFWQFRDKVTALSGISHLEQVYLWGDVHISGQGDFGQLVEAGGTQEVHVIRKSTCLSRVGVRCRGLYDREQRAGAIKNTFPDSSTRSVRIQAQQSQEVAAAAAASEVLDAASEAAEASVTDFIDYSNFDAVFEEDASQTEVCGWVLGDCIKQAVEMEGGTTFLISAAPNSERALIAWNDVDDLPEMDGIIPRAIRLAFQDLHALQEEEQSQRMVTVSFLSHYNEELGDLLDGGRPGHRPKLRLRESLRTGVYAAGLSETVVQGPDAALGLLRQGRTVSQVENTTMERSESDCGYIFTLSIWKRQQVPDEEPMLSPSRLRFVLLQCMRQLVTPAGFVAQGPARSLGSFMKVVRALHQAREETNEGTRPRFVPFRDSSVTRLLQKELSGADGRLVVLSLCNPVSDDAQRTCLELATLLQGTRCCCAGPTFSAQNLFGIWFGNPSGPVEGQAERALEPIFGLSMSCGRPLQPTYRAPYVHRKCTSFMQMSGAHLWCHRPRHLESKGRLRKERH